jgi:hypothetical protein
MRRTDQRKQLREQAAKMPSNISAKEFVEFVRRAQAAGFGVHIDRFGRIRLVEISTPWQRPAGKRG